MVHTHFRVILIDEVFHLADMFPGVSDDRIKCVLKELGFSGAVDNLLGLSHFVSTTMCFT